MIIAADHPARGANGVGDKPLAMGNRISLLERLEAALARPGVDGLLASPDILEDLLLLGALEGKVAIGSMNRGGLQGASFEFDDQFTGYDAQACADMGLNGGKTLTRIALDDPGTVNTMVATAKAINELAELQADGHGRAVLVVAGSNGKVRNDLSADAVIKSVGSLQRAGPDLGLHLDEAAGGAGDGTGDGLHHAADPAARRRPGHQSGGDLRLLAGGAGAAVGARPGGRPHPALPGRRRCRRRGRHRGLDGAVTAVTAADRCDNLLRQPRLYVPAGSDGHGHVRPGDHAGIGGLGVFQPAGGHPRAR